MEYFGLYGLLIVASILFMGITLVTSTLYYLIKLTLHVRKKLIKEIKKQYDNKSII